MRLALDLASFGGSSISAEQLIERQSRMLTDHGYPGALARIGQRDLSRLRSLGRELTGVLALADQGSFVAALSVLLDVQDCRPRLTVHDGAGSPYLHFARDGAPLPIWVGTMAVSGLVLYVCRYGRSRLRPCAADGCGRWYADESRNASRRYCSAACASRTTVAAFRHRQAAG